MNRMQNSIKFLKNSTKKARNFLSNLFTIRNKVIFIFIVLLIQVIASINSTYGPFEVMFIWEKIINLFNDNFIKKLFIFQSGILFIWFSLLYLYKVVKKSKNPFRYIFENNRIEYIFIFATNLLLNFLMVLVCWNNINKGNGPDLNLIFSDPVKIVGYGSIYLYSISSLLFLLKRKRVVHLNNISKNIVKHFMFRSFSYVPINRKIRNSLESRTMLFLFSRKGSGKSKHFIKKFDFNSSSGDKINLTKKVRKKLQKQFIHLSCSDLMHTEEDLYVKLGNKLINVNTMQSLFKSKIGMEFKFNKSSNAFSKLANKIIVIDDLELLYDVEYGTSEKSSNEDKILCKSQKVVINKFFGFFKLIEDYFENESNREFKPIIIFTGSSNPFEILNDMDSHFFANKLGDVSIHKHDIIELPIFRMNMHDLAQQHEHIEKSRIFGDSDNQIPELGENLHNIRHGKNNLNISSKIGDSFGSNIFLRLEIIDPKIINTYGQEFGLTSVEKKSLRMTLLGEYFNGDGKITTNEGKFLMMIHQFEIENLPTKEFSNILSSITINTEPTIIMKISNTNEEIVKFLLFQKDKIRSSNIQSSLLIFVYFMEINEGIIYRFKKMSKQQSMEIIALKVLISQNINGRKREVNDLFLKLLNENRHINFKHNNGKLDLKIIANCIEYLKSKGIPFYRRDSGYELHLKQLFVKYSEILNLDFSQYMELYNDLIEKRLLENEFTFAELLEMYGDSNE